MVIIKSERDVVTGDVVIGPWPHYEFCMRGEMFRSVEASRPAHVVVWLVNPAEGRKWKVCNAKAAYTISDVVFTEPFTWDEHYAGMWREKAVARLIEHSPGLWRRTGAAQLAGAYMRVVCGPCKEVGC